MNLSTKFVKLIVLCIFCSFFVNSQDVCLSIINSCTCMFPNGSGIDLLPSRRGTVHKTSTYQLGFKTGTIAEYHYYPCFDGLMETMPDVPRDKNNCRGYAALCGYLFRSYVASSNVDRSYEYMGTSNYTEFAPNGSYIKYSSTKKKSTVYLVCSDGADKLYAKDVFSKGPQIFQFFSRSACLTEIVSKPNKVAEMTMIFVPCLAVLFVTLGFITKRFLMSATGVQVATSWMFWMKLPVIIKDGWAFMAHGYRVPHQAPVPPGGSGIRI